MVAVFGVVTPNPDLRPATYHILPAKYLVDPTVPDLPADLSLPEMYCRLPPPPLFFSGGRMSNVSLLHSAETKQEAHKEGLGGGGPFARYLTWGKPWGELLFLVHGFL